MPGSCGMSRSWTRSMSDPIRCCTGVTSGRSNNRYSTPLQTRDHIDGQHGLGASCYFAGEVASRGVAGLAQETQIPTPNRFCEILSSWVTPVTEVPLMMIAFKHGLVMKGEDRYPLLIKADCPLTRTPRYSLPPNRLAHTVQVIPEMAIGHGYRATRSR